jgi:hypothetical protein
MARFETTAPSIE